MGTIRLIVGNIIDNHDCLFFINQSDNLRNELFRIMPIKGKFCRRYAFKNDSNRIINRDKYYAIICKQVFSNSQPRIQHIQPICVKSTITFTILYQLVSFFIGLPAALCIILGFRDLIWQFFNEESLKHLHEGDMGLYRNTRLDMYEFLFEETKYEQAFNLLCEVIAYDLSGMDNSEFSDIEEKFRLQLMLKYDFPYSQSNAKLPPAIKQWMANLQGRLELSDDALRERLLQQFESISLYRCIFTNAECVDIVMAELIDDADILDTIYHKAEARLRAQLKAI